MHFILLTHSRELSKKTATGPLIKHCLPLQCDIIEWSRTSADPRITQELDPLKTLLIYPHEKNNSGIKIEQGEIAQFDTFIILDGTWQEARKMYNRSPYLHNLVHYTLEVDYSSSYQLRRNQKNIGLCTAEVAIELLKQKQYFEIASHLETAYNHLNSTVK